MRQVSHDGISAMSEKENDKKRRASDSGCASPVRCVSEFDKITAVAFKGRGDQGFADERLIEHVRCPSIKNVPTNDAPYLPNPLHNPSLFTHHAQSLRLEADLHPMRLILSRLMTNLTFNRQGVFNIPVDPVALVLPDYFNVVMKPMDLGTIKDRLHSVAYHSRQEVAEDIRLCFRNAMAYNPPQNFIYTAADELLSCFEDLVQSFCPELAYSEVVYVPDAALPSHTEAVSPKQSPTGDVECVITIAERPLIMGRPDVSPENPHSFACLAAVATAHTLSTRKSNPDDILLAPSVATMTARRRKKRGSKSNSGHNCQWCHGNFCAVCDQGCLPLEPTLLICNGPHCIGAKVRKGVTYYIAPDGSCQYCQRCYAGLSAVLPQSGKNEDAEVCRYKRDLLKRKNDEETVEHWLTCVKCHSAVHRMCVMHNPYVHCEESYHCPDCADCGNAASSTPQGCRADDKGADMYTFIAGSDLPVPMSDVACGSFVMGGNVFSAAALSETAVSSFIEAKVRDRMVSVDCPNAEATVVVRIISECERFFKVPDVIRKHFQMRGESEGETGVVPPTKVMYRSKAIALFQRIDGLDVCIFCMYVQEYSGDGDEFESLSDKAKASQQKRVYIAYLDSVEHFRPRTCRTQVYQEVLTAYLATARKRGFEAAHIWACPPSRGNSFVFWNHPAAQRTPTMERLTAWYHAAISRAIDCGVVSDVKSLYESHFEESMRQIESTTFSDAATPKHKLTCPPLLEGDFWIEEAVRVHSISLARHSKEKAVGTDYSPSSATTDDLHDPCPALQIAAMLLDRIIAHPSSAPFRRPVNASALKLTDYHKIVAKPMDLGTVHSRCVFGEYGTLRELVADVDLVFSNAKKFNPPGHMIHATAIELCSLFITELDRMTFAWLGRSIDGDARHSWEVFSDMSMSLDTTMMHIDGVPPVEGSPTIGSVEVLSTSAGSSQSLPPSGESSTCCLLTKSETLTTLPTANSNNGPDAVHHRMVGGDVWLLDKKNRAPPKGRSLTKKSKRGRKSLVDSLDEPAPKRRRQTWLGEEIGVTVRRMRTSFFNCSLLPGPAVAWHGDQKVGVFDEYADIYNPDGDSTLLSHRVADARHALLEFSQFRSLEFDTLRRAKYSSSILLHHLHNERAPGLIPDCTTCSEVIDGVRWHRISKVVERRPASARPVCGRKPKVASSGPFEPEELCSSCYSRHANQDQFIPLQVSL